MKGTLSLLALFALSSAMAFACDDSSNRGASSAVLGTESGPASVSWLQGQPVAAEKAVWNVTLKQDSQATSNLEINNRCKGSHHFNVNAENAKFMEFATSAPVRVGGHQSLKLPVRFNSDGLQSGEYKGNVLVLCVDCKSEATCTQDRENLPVVLTVTPPDPGSIQVGHDNVTPVQQNKNDLLQQEEYFLPSGAQTLNRANAVKWWASPFPPPGVMLCCCCCPQVQPVGPPAQPPSPKPTSPPITVKTNLELGKFGPGKGIHILVVAGTGQYAAEAYIQWAASGGTGQLTVELDVQRPGASGWEKLVAGMGPDDDHLFVTHVPGTYTFKAIAKDATGKSSFNTTTVVFPSI